MTIKNELAEEPLEEMLSDTALKREVVLALAGNSGMRDRLKRCFLIFVVLGTGC